MKHLARKPKYFVQDIQDELSRIMEETFGDIGITAFPSDNSVLPPAVELLEKDGCLKLKAQLPGIDKKDIDVEISENSVRIKAEMHQEEEITRENCYKNEIRYGKFLRNINLPYEVDSSKAKAEFKNGILSIKIPKSEELKKKSKKIEIES